ncbi:MAG: WD40 repeat domain-containing protein, partial [Deltaproteobacteria bacterium]|nr:WD40 repeat domain-containing protein [Deltaproteobacteria bacterium]
MVDTNSWDWDTGEKVLADTSSWKDKFEWVEEFQASPDGEKVTAIVKTGEGEFNVCVNGQTWENPFDRIWCLRFGPDGRLACIISANAEWTV